MPSGKYKNEVEVITGVERRRRWSAQEKLQWVRRTMEPGMTVSLVAREAGITTSQLFQWRKAYTEGSLVAVGANEPVVPASDLQDAMKRIRQLEAALGRNTLENEILKEAVDFGQSKKVDCALTSIARGRPVRLVCSALGVARSHIAIRRNRPAHWIDRRTARARVDDTATLEAIKSVVKDLATYGYRRVWGVLRYSGLYGAINHKRVYRVMRDHNLLLYRQGQRPVDTRRHDGKVAVDNSNVRWCSDGFELSCDNGERVRVAFALDCCDREVMSWVATTRGIDAGLVGDLMMQAVEYRFGVSSPVPNEIEWLSDNGSCYTAQETRTFARQLGLKPVTTPVESPQSNGMAESLVKTIKRDYASLALRPDARTVLKQLPDWFEHYNTRHPHSALKYMPPRMFREKQALNN
ncbi:IS3 family transposase [Oxalobacteraceae bacterium R-40]|uniref:IS3 family transposase n=1 Tax=Keguizhuia sedimenti TaxID=3064264 RepID=A0ABU1BPW0_9BURK|nr:IS3 family transposase [Oxalobacteraceae bacterium R-40]